MSGMKNTPWARAALRTDSASRASMRTIVCVSRQPWLIATRSSSTRHERGEARRGEVGSQETALLLPAHARVVEQKLHLGHAHELS